MRVIVWSKVSRCIWKDTVSLIFSRLLLMFVPNVRRYRSLNELVASKLILQGRLTTTSLGTTP